MHTLIYSTVRQYSSYPEYQVEDEHQVFEARITAAERHFRSGTLGRKSNWTTLTQNQMTGCTTMTMKRLTQFHSETQLSTLYVFAT